MRTLQIKTILRLMTAALMVLPPAGAVLIFVQVDQIDQGAHSLAEHTVGSVLLFDACVQASVRAETLLVTAALAQDAARAGGAIDLMQAQLFTAEQAWAQFNVPKVQNGRFVQARRWWALRQEVTQRGLRPAAVAIHDGDFGRARELVLVEVMARREASAVAADLFLVQERGWVTSVLGNLQASVSQIRRVASAVPFVVFCIGLLVFFVSRSIERPLLSMVSVAKALGTGDTAARVKIESDNELAILGRALNEMADRIAEANHRLEALATTDGLTDLLNRRAFDTRLREEWSRACRTGLPLSILLIDVDHFKAYNDTYGHPAGDAALVSVASALRASATRAGDKTARYGGEEFVALLSATGTTGALVVAERFRARLAALSIPHRASTVGATLSTSIGVASVVPVVGAEPKSLVEAADAALYNAKQAGRDRVRVGGAS